MPITDEEKKAWHGQRQHGLEVDEDIIDEAATRADDDDGPYDHCIHCGARTSGEALCAACE